MSSISPVSTLDVFPRNCNNEDNVLNMNSLSEPLMGEFSGAASCPETQDLSPEVAIETVQIPESRSNTDTIACENLALPVAETENNNVGTIGVWDCVPSSRTGSVASSSTRSYNTAGLSQNYHQNRYRPQYQRGNGFNTRGGYRGGRGLQNRNRFNTNHCRGRFNNWNPNPGFYTGAVNFNGPVLFSQPPPMHQNHNLPRMVNPQLQQHEYFNAPNTGFNAGPVNFVPHQHENFDSAWFSQPPPMHWNPNLPIMDNPQLQQRERFNGPSGFSTPPPMQNWFPTGPSDVSDWFSCPRTPMPPHPIPRSAKRT